MRLSLNVLAAFATVGFFCAIDSYASESCDKALTKEPRESWSVPREFKQMTFSPGLPANEDFSDPSTPLMRSGHRLTITSSGVLTWKGKDDLSAWQSFLNGEKPTFETIPLYHSDGKTPLDIPTWGEEAWDMTFESFGGEEVIFGGVMTPKPGELHAKWPEDNYSRRTYLFTKKNGRWVQSPKPLFFDPVDHGWLGHNYGHHFFKDMNGNDWMFYERVSEVLNNSPSNTELFMRKVISPSELETDDHEITVFKRKKAPYPATVRGPNNALAEGPRPFMVQIEGKTFYLVSFSSGQWDSDQYGLNLLWSDQVEGPYHPYLTSNGKDLKDFGAALKLKHQLTWGPGRGAFFQDPNGQWWVIYNAIDRETVAHGDVTPVPGKGPYRNLYLNPVRISLSKKGIPEVEILGQE